MLFERPSDSCRYLLSTCERISTADAQLLQRQTFNNATANSHCWKKVQTLEGCDLSAVSVDVSMSDDCKVCNGSGYLEVFSSDMDSSNQDQCERCNGTGKRQESTCPICGQEMRYSEHDEWICSPKCHEDD